MDRSQHEAVGRKIVWLGLVAFYLAMISGAGWLLLDLLGTYNRGQLAGVGSWVVAGWVGLLAITVAGSGIYGLWRTARGFK